MCAQTTLQFFGYFRCVFFFVNGTQNIHVENHGLLLCFSIVFVFVVVQCDHVLIVCLYFAFPVFQTPREKKNHANVIKQAKQNKNYGYVQCTKKGAKMAGRNSVRNKKKKKQAVTTIESRINQFISVVGPK